jgi:chromosome segregation ATPase
MLVQYNQNLLTLIESDS